ncbi:MAG: hypothetical protein H6735_24875 [Alphaproteobacteria bacterium]|nr:hypothetical protein [Alphaproteobacteria bacterium]
MGPASPATRLGLLPASYLLLAACAKTVPATLPPGESLREAMFGLGHLPIHEDVGLAVSPDGELTVLTSTITLIQENGPSGRSVLRAFETKTGVEAWVITSDTWMLGIPAIRPDTHQVVVPAKPFDNGPSPRPDWHVITLEAASGRISSECPLQGFGDGQVPSVVVPRQGTAETYVLGSRGLVCSYPTSVCDAPTCTTLPSRPDRGDPDADNGYLSVLARQYSSERHFGVHPMVGGGTADARCIVTLGPAGLVETVAGQQVAWNREIHVPIEPFMIASAGTCGGPIVVGTHEGVWAGNGDEWWLVTPRGVPGNPR